MKNKPAAVLIPAKTLTRLLFLAASALLIVSLIFTYLVGLHVLRANRDAARDKSVIQQLDLFLSTLKDAETGQRGYLITGKLPYLAPYQAATKHIDEQQSTLHALAMTGEVSPADANMLAQLARQKIAELELTIQLRRTNAPAAIAMLETDRGKKLMDGIRTLVAKMSSAAEKKYGDAMRRSYSATLARTVAFALTLTINLAFLTWAFRRVLREIESREAQSLETFRQKEILATTLASIGDGVIVTDAQGAVTFMNSEGERLTGWKSAESQGKLLPAVFKIINETTRNIVENPVDKVLRTGRVVGLANHTLLIRKDGDEIPIDDSAAPIRQRDGSLFGVVLVFRDFSEHKKAEQALRESERLYRAIGESIDFGIWVCAPDGRNIYASPSFLKLVGMTQEQCADFNWASVLHPDDIENTLTAWQDCVRRGGLWDTEHRFRGVDGNWHPVLARGVAVRDEAGKVTGWAGINLDISRQKNAEEALKEAQKKLQAHAEGLEKTVAERTARLTEMIAELQHVSYAITHDMRAPLRAMTSYADIIMEGLAKGGAAADNNEYCRRIMVGATRLDKLITDALSYTKAVLLELPMQPVDLSTLINGILNTYPNLHPDNANIKIEGQLPVVFGNESLLTQCFSNLLGNAVKFVAPGVFPVVRINATLTGNVVRLCIADNGIGIPENAQSRLFGMFQKLDNEYEGTGIGLAVVRKVVERMGGKVSAESTVGQGSLFFIELPVSSQAATPKT